MAGELKISELKIGDPVARLWAVRARSGRAFKNSAEASKNSHQSIKIYLSLAQARDRARLRAS
jgi:hypothetical protein